MLSYSPNTVNTNPILDRWARFNPQFLVPYNSYVDSNEITIKGPSGIKTAYFYCYNVAGVNVFKNGVLAGQITPGANLPVSVTNGDKIKLQVITLSTLASYASSLRFGQVLMVMSQTYDSVYSYFIVTPDFESSEYLISNPAFYTDPSFVIPQTIESDMKLKYRSDSYNGIANRTGELVVQAGPVSPVVPERIRNVAFVSDYARNVVHRVVCDYDMEVLNSISVSSPYDVSCTTYSEPSQPVYVGVTIPDSNLFNIYSADSLDLLDSVPVVGRPLHVAARRKLATDTYDCAFWVSCYDSNQIALVSRTSNVTTVTYYTLTTGTNPTKIDVTPNNTCQVITTTGFARVTPAGVVSYVSTSGQPSAISSDSYHTYVVVPSTKNVLRFSLYGSSVVTTFNSNVAHLTGIVVADFYNPSNENPYNLIYLYDVFGSVYMLNTLYNLDNGAFSFGSIIKLVTEVDSVYGITFLDGVLYYFTNYGPTANIREPRLIPDNMESEIETTAPLVTGSGFIRSEYLGPISGIDNSSFNISMPNGLTGFTVRGGNTATSTTSPVPFINGNYFQFTTAASVNNATDYSEYHIPAVTRNFIWWWYIKQNTGE